MYILQLVWVFFWLEHFKETLNQCPGDSTFGFSTPNRATDLDVRTDAITTEETAAAIKLLKNGQAPGLDMVSAEMLQHSTWSTKWQNYLFSCVTNTLSHVLIVVKSCMYKIYISSLLECMRWKLRPWTQITNDTINDNEWQKHLGIIISDIRKHFMKIAI